MTETAVEIGAPESRKKQLRTILFVIDSFGGGGVERCLSYITGRLHGSTFRILVSPYLAEMSLPAHLKSFHHFPPGTILPALIKSRRKFRQPWHITAFLRFMALVSTLHKLPVSRQDFSSSYRWVRRFLDNYYCSILALNEIIKKEKPGLILAFARNSALIALITRFLYRLPIPICCSHRGHLSKRIYYKPNAGLFKVLSKMFFKRADFHTAVSNGIREDVIDKFNVPAAKIATLYNGVDIESVRKQCREPIEDDRISRLLSDPGVAKIMNIGRLSETKGQETLIRAFQKVLRSRVNCRLFIAGKGERKEYLQSLAQELGIAESVHFLGWHRNPLKFLARCDFFVSGSYSEGFPNVLLEAMAAGLPIIAADCEFGPRELLADGKFGILVPIKDENALAEAMIRVLTDHDLRKQLQSLSTERIQSFRVELMIRKYEELLTHGKIKG